MALRRPVWVAVVVALALAAACLPAIAAADWAPVAPEQLSSPGAWALSVSAASVGGVPYVTWAQGASASAVSGPVYVAALSGGAFSIVGGGAVGACDEDPGIADVNGTPYVACIASGGVGVEIYSLSGSTWTQVGAAIPNAQSGAPVGVAEAAGVPYVALASSATDKVGVYAFSGGNWAQVGASLLGAAGGLAQGPALLSDGSSPIVAWTETDPVSGGTQQYVYGDQLNGGSWSPLNAGAQLNTSASENARLDGLAMIGSTPYLALDEFGSSGPSEGSALALSGSSFEPLGGPIVTNSLGYFPQVALGALDGQPLALTADQDGAGDPSLTAETFSAGAWGTLGYPLGVAPLPGPNGTPYAGSAIAVDAQGTPYAFFLQQDATSQSGQEDLFVEAYTPAGVNPNTPVAATPSPPQVTVAPLPALPAASTTSTPAAVVEFIAAPSLRRHGKTVQLKSGIDVSCPAATKPCKGEVAIEAEKATSPAVGATLTWAFTVPAGRVRDIALSISGTKLKRLRSLSKQRLRGLLKITITGPNGESSALSQTLNTRLP